MDAHLKDKSARLIIRFLILSNSTRISTNTGTTKRLQGWGHATFLKLRGDSNINIKASWLVGLVLQVDLNDVHQVHLERMWTNINIKLSGGQFRTGSTIRSSCSRPERAISADWYSSTPANTSNTAKHFQHCQTLLTLPSWTDTHPPLFQPANTSKLDQFLVRLSTRCFI